MRSDWLKQPSELLEPTGSRTVVADGVEWHSMEGYVGPRELYEATRQHTETLYKLGTKVGIPGTDRAHFWGHGFVREMVRGLALAPSAVNRIVQNFGIENVVRSYANDLAHSSPGSGVFLRIDGNIRQVVSPTGDAVKTLDSISYRVQIVDDVSAGKARDVFEFHIDLTKSGDGGPLSGKVVNEKDWAMAKAAYRASKQGDAVTKNLVISVIEQTLHE